MPTVNIQGFGSVNFPDSMSADEIQSAIQRDIIPQAKPNPTDQSQYPEATTLNNFLAGMGKGMEDIGRGIGQRVGLVDQKSIDQARAYDAQLMQTKAGSVGNFAGNLAATLPAALVPGANTVAGAALIGGALGAAQPTATGESVLRNTAMGAGLGGLGQYGLGKLAGMAGNRLTAATDAGNAAAAQNAARDATLEASQQAGYRVPPAQANPILLNRMMEGYAGKAATAQSASLKNQAVTDRLISGDIGLTPASTLKDIRAVRAQSGDAYQVVKDAGTLIPDDAFAARVANLGGEDHAAMLADFPELANSGITDLQAALNKPQFSAKSAVGLLKQLRNDSAANFRNRMDPAKLALAQAQEDAAGALEDLAGRTLATQGKPGALQAFKDARTTIAKTYAAENARNPATGNYAASDFGKAFDKGKPLTGGMETVGRFASAYPKAAQEITTSMPGISPLDYAAAGITSAATGRPEIMASLLGRPLARSLILSGPYQRMFATPSYGPGLLTRGAAPTLEELKKLGISGLLAPSIYAAQQ